MDEVLIIMEKIGVGRFIGLTIIAVELILLAGFLIRLFFLKLQGRGKNKYWQDTPSSLPPFAVGMLMYSNEKFEDCLAAEIANFIDKGILKANKVNGRLTMQVMRQPYESDGLWDYQYGIFRKFIEGKADSNGIITLESFKINNGSLGLSVPMIMGNLRKDLVNRGYLNERIVEPIRDKVFAVCFVLFLLSIPICLPLFFKTGIAIFDITIIPIILLIIAIYKSAATNVKDNLSSKGKREYKKWLSFRRFLSNYGRFSDRGTRDVMVWRKFLVYATVFDLSDKLTDEVNDVMTKEIIRELKKVFINMGIGVVKGVAKSTLKRRTS